MLEHALWAAADFGDVLPLTSERKPCVAFAEATSDPDKIVELWKRWSDAGVGLCAWSASLLVLDVEHISKSGADGYETIASLERVIGPLPPTRTHSTKSGGEHRVYALDRDAPSIRSAQGTLRGAQIGAPGLDIVTGRAVLRWPPTPGYTIKMRGAGSTMDGGGGCAPLPDAWITALADPPPPKHPPVYVETESDGLVYALAAMKSEAIELASLAAGRNCALTKSAYNLGQLAPPLSYAQIESVLLSCCETNGALKDHGHRACVQTITRGYRAGQRNPRHVSPRL